MKNWNHDINNAETNSRAFQRYAARASVRLRLENSGDIFSASIKNYSKGGIGLTSRTAVPENSLIRITTPVSEITESSPLHSSELKVLWSRKRSDDQMPTHESGGKWISVRCDWCNKTVPFRQLHQTVDSISLCNECMDELDSHLRGQLKECMHEYLLGNIL